MVLIDDIFKQICAVLNWDFVEGDDFWNNTKDVTDPTHGADDTDLAFEDKRKYFFLLSKSYSNQLNDYGAVEARTWSGELVIGVRSNLTDPSYEYKLEHQINPLYSEVERMSSYIPDCEGLVLESWGNTEEVADAYDSNFDGIKVSFRVKHYAV